MSEPCLEWTDQLSDHANGLLPEDQVAALKEHLNACAACRSAHALAAELARTLGTAPVRVASPAAFESAWTRIRDERAKAAPAPQRRPWLRIPRRGWAAAAAALLLTGAVTYAAALWTRGDGYVDLPSLDAGAPTIGVERTVMVTVILTTKRPARPGQAIELMSLGRTVAAGKLIAPGSRPGEWTVELTLPAGRRLADGDRVRLGE